jgi:Na+/melibiose symporter-like transporter
MVAFAGPGFVSGALVYGAVFILPALLAAELGISLTAIGVVLTVARIFDAVTDPVVGSLSDRHAARGGDRRLWVLVGTIATGLAGVPLMSAWLPSDAAAVLVVYCLFFLAWTVLEIPHSAWGASLSHDPQRRTLAFTLKGVAYGLGTVAFMTAPYLPFFGGKGFTPEFMTTAALALAVVAVLTGVVAWRFGPPSLSTPEGASSGSPLRLIVKQTLGNRPFVLFLLSFVALAIGLGIWGGVLFVVGSAYFQLADRVPLLFALGSPVSLLAIAFWYAVVRRIGQRPAWAAGVVVSSAALLAAGFLPPDPAVFPALLGLVLVYFAAMPVMTVVVPAYLANIVDYARLRHGDERAGLLFSVYVFVTKLAAALGAGVGLSLLGLFGFDPAAGATTPLAETGVVIVFGVIPAALTAVSCLLIVLNPLNARRIEVIRRRLEQLDRRAAAAQTTS